jgi:hypothetical protein
VCWLQSYYRYISLGHELENQDIGPSPMCACVSVWCIEDESNEEELKGKRFHFVSKVLRDANRVLRGPSFRPT